MTRIIAVLITALVLSSVSWCFAWQAPTPTPEAATTPTTTPTRAPAVVPTLDPHKALALALLQRDINLLSTEMSQLQAAHSNCQAQMPGWAKDFEARKVSFDAKQVELTKQLDAAKVAGYMLDQRELVYVKENTPTPSATAASAPVTPIVPAKASVKTEAKKP